MFCPRITKLREFMLLRREWFGAVNSEIHAYKTVSADPYGSEDFQAFKDDESDALKVLYCVNQLNEAVHVKGGRCHRDGQTDEITDRVLPAARTRTVFGRKPNPARF